ncbi:hypothetical protein NAU58_00015 [Pseudomonas stutzeri]|uniref:Uncharacterized protein n=1 Tax=Stutzerimonas stutzeri TaxID=316 RepID=A0A2N8S4U7_STUST|nr:hypothetical protein [Stutzerimonas stutzeri]MCQ4293949.1 hypothetical protein [Stutzerimonas stutzeri]PNF81651.1 hypothetical protein CXK92_07425 [Stutzerimonas stutzeri]
MLALGLSLALSTQAAEQRVYLIATVQLDGSSLAQSVFLHEAHITELQGCLDAVRDGQSKRDWLLYRHIFRRDRFKGFSGHVRYHCGYSEQRFSSWHDGPRYNKPYLIYVDDAARLSVIRTPSQAQCMTQLRALPVGKQAQSFCAMGNQELLP